MAARASEREPKQPVVAALTSSLEPQGARDVALLLLFVLFDRMILMKAVCRMQDIFEFTVYHKTKS